MHRMDLKPLVVKEARVISLEPYSFPITKQSNKLYRPAMDSTNSNDTNSLDNTIDTPEHSNNKDNSPPTGINADSSAHESRKQSPNDDGADNIPHKADETKSEDVELKDRHIDSAGTEGGVPKHEQEIKHSPNKSPQSHETVHSSFSPQQITTVQTNSSAQESEGALVKDNDGKGTKNDLFTTTESEHTSVVKNTDGTVCSDVSKTLEVSKKASDGKVDGDQDDKEGMCSHSESMDADPLGEDNSKHDTAPRVTEIESMKRANQDDKTTDKPVDSTVESKLEPTSSDKQFDVKHSSTPQEPPPIEKQEQNKPVDIVPETTSEQVVSSDIATEESTTVEPPDKSKLVSEVIPTVDKSPPQRSPETRVEVVSNASSPARKPSNTPSIVPSSSGVPTGVASPVSVISSPRVAVPAHVPVLKGSLKVPFASTTKDQDKLAIMGAEKLKVGQAELLHASVDLLGQQKQIEIKSREEITRRAPPQVAVIPPMDFSKSHEARFKKKKAEKGGGRDGALVIEKAVNVAHPTAHRG